MYRQKETLHGNNTKIDPKKHVESLYQSNMVTLSNSKKDGVPVVDDDDVAYARRFVEENKK